MTIRRNSRPVCDRRLADVVRITTRKPEYLPSVQVVLQAQLRHSGAGMSVLS